jgi:FKBP-type peptidyl-prolyl cis-trans isomerase (trigger factor)
MDIGNVTKSTISREQNGTIKLTVVIPYSIVAKTREEVIESAVKTAELPGFRKGKAPRNLVEKKLDEAKIQEEIIKKLLPQAYMKAIEEHNVRPIMSPKIHIDKIEEGRDLTFEALTCETPEVKLNDYKDKVKGITAKSKIVIPGKEKQQEPKFDEIIKAVLEAATVEIPAMLIQHEADRLLSQTLDEIKRLGLTLDQYLASTGKTAETLRKEYEEKARNDIKLEFVLQKIAESEKITVQQQEIDEAIQKAKDPQERENLEQNRYLLASILRQQKTLDFLKNL